MAAILHQILYWVDTKPFIWECGLTQKYHITTDNNEYNVIDVIYQ